MMSLLIAVAILLFLPMLIGMLLHKVIKETKKNKIVTYLMGVLMLFFLFELVVTIGIKLELTFSAVFTIFMAICFLLIIITLGICRKEIKTLTLELQEQLTLNLGRIVIVILFVFLCINFFIYKPSNSSDIIEETIRTTLATNTIYQYNPITGGEFVNGMFPITKLSTLPIFYAGIAQISEIPVGQLLYQVIPIWILFMSFLVFYQWGCKLFDSEKKKNTFLIWCGMLLLFAEEGSAHLSFQLLHSTWVGNTIVISVIIPFFLYMGLSCWEEKKIKYGLASLAVFGVTTITLVNTTTIGKILFENMEASKGKIVGYALIVLIYGVVTGRFEKKKAAIYYCCLIAVGVLLGLWIPMIAFVITDIFKFIPKKRQWECALGISFLIFISGSILLYGDKVGLEKIKTTTAESVINVVEEIEKKRQTKIIMVAPNVIMEQVRKQSGTIQLPYGRDYWIEDINKEIGDIYDNKVHSLYGSMLEIEKDWEKVFELAEEVGCNVIVSPMPMEEEKLKTNWKFHQEVSNYYIYTR